MESGSEGIRTSPRNNQVVRSFLTIWFHSLNQAVRKQDKPTKCWGYGLIAKEGQFCQ